MTYDVSSVEHAMTPRRRMHPMTWVAAAALLPLVCWDAWQTQHEIRARREASTQYTQVPTRAVAPQARSRFWSW